jgi:hypothetical protein
MGNVKIKIVNISDNETLVKSNTFTKDIADYHRINAYKTKEFDLNEINLFHVERLVMLGRVAVAMFPVGLTETQQKMIEEVSRFDLMEVEQWIQ